MTTTNAAHHQETRMETMAGTRAPVRMWIDPTTVEHAALSQVRNVADLPWTHGVALMPDAHHGKGATVGSVIAMRDAVSPSAVGVDIGCGMSAVPVRMRADQLPDDLSRIRAAIEAVVPVGMSSHDGMADVRGAGLRGWNEFLNAFDDLTVTLTTRRLNTDAYRERVFSQIGTLGGGNHFIEVCADEAGQVWLMLHSGSRNVGKELAERHIAAAKELPHNQDLPDRDLAVFLAGTPEMDAYRRDLWWAQEYARRNRAVMMGLVKAAFVKALGAPVQFGEETSCFAGETEVLTRDGERPIGDLVGGRHELLTTGGAWVKAPVESFGQQRIVELVVGRFGHEKVIRTTAGHRWLLRPKVAHNRTEATTMELRVGDRLDYAFPQRPTGLRPGRAGVARGFVFGDGSALAAGGCARAFFFGEKDVALLPFVNDAAKVRTYYYRYDAEVSERKAYVRLAEVTPEAIEAGELKPYRVLGGLPREWKTEFPALDGPADDLYGWLAGYFAADGEVGKTGRPAIWSANRAHLEFYKAACDTLGIWTLPIRERTRSGWGAAASAMYVMGISRADLTPEFFVHDEHRRRWEANRHAVERRGWTVREVRETDTIEEVFCAVVDGTHSFTLADNILTGNCHHNYVSEETYDGLDLLITRKGAISTQGGRLGIIPGSMGTGSYIVKGLGNEAAFCSASHGAGRKMSRNEAKRRFTVEDLAEQTAGVECRKDAGVVDEIPGAYKSLESVMAQQTDLVEVVHRLTTLVCVKG